MDSASYLLDPRLAESLVLRWYLKVLEHLAPGAVKIACGDRERLGIKPTLKCAFVTIPYRATGLLIRVGVEPPPSQSPYRPAPTWRLSMICRLLIAMEVELGNPRQSFGKWRDDVSTAWEAITGRYREAISLSELATRLETSSDYLGGRVIQLLGGSFRQLLAEERVAHAGRRLLQTDDSIREIMAGIEGISPSQFNRNFLSVICLTPRAYRKKYVGT